MPRGVRTKSSAWKSSHKRVAHGRLGKADSMACARDAAFRQQRLQSDQEVQVDGGEIDGNASVHWHSPPDGSMTGASNSTDHPAATPEQAARTDALSLIG